MGSDLSLNAHHLGLIVPDLEVTMKAYIANFGLSFSVFELDETDSAFSGSSASFKLRVGFGFAGASAIELIQPVSGETIHSAFLRQNGPGIHHLGFWVDDLKSARKQLEERGCSLLLQGTIDDLGSFAYYEAPDLHCVVEPIQFSLGLPISLAKHAKSYAGN
jgi:catechol 2,3-dioxygenase-like lactoylglutathione lyase family enzyme